MMNRQTRLLALLLLTLTRPLAAATGEAGADVTASQRTAAQERQQSTLQALQQAPLEGQKLQLETAEDQALALFKPALGKQRGGVVLLHDRGGHVDAAGVIRPLRLGLAEAGWATLTIQLPPPEAPAVGTAWLDRTQALIAAGLNELQQRDINSIVLLGHGLGALAATDYLAAGDNLTVRGLIIVGLDGSAADEPRMDGAAQLARVRPPILDIFGERDSRAVLASAERRAQAARRREGGEETAHTLYRDVARRYSERKGDSVSYRQLRIAAADHRFTRQQQLLLRRIRGWLQRHAADGGNE